jgi:hypothetical protein
MANDKNKLDIVATNASAGEVEAPEDVVVYRTDRAADE